MLFNTKDSGTLLGAISQKVQTSKDIKNYEAILQGYGNHKDALFGFQGIVGASDEFNDKIKEIIKTVEDAKGTGEDVFNAIQEQMDATAAKGTKLGNSIKSFFKGMLNGIVSMVTTAVISFAIDALISKLDKEIITAKEAAKMAGEFNNSFASMQKEQSDTIKTISELEEEFTELSKGVNGLGHNVNLTEAEFERYHEITAIIADKIPTLVKGYDDQGNAIIRLKDDVNSLTDAYKSMQEQQARSEYRATDNKGSRIISGVYKNAQNVIDDTQKRYDGLKETRDNLLKLIELDDEDFNKFVDRLGNLDTDYNSELEELISKAGYTGTDSDDYDEIHKNLVEAYKETESEFRQYEADLNTAATDIAKAGQLYVKGVSTYWRDLNDSQRGMLDTFLSQIDTIEDIGDISLNFGFNITNEQDMIDFVTQLIGDFHELSSEDLEQIDTYFNLETSFNNSQISYNEYLAQLQTIQNWLNSLDGDQKKIVDILFKTTVDDTNDVDAIMSDARKAARTYNKRSFERSQRDIDIDEWLNSLTAEQLKLVPTLELKGDELVPEMQKLLNEAQEVADSNPIEVKTKYSEQTASLDELEKSFSGLATTYDTTVNLNAKVDAGDLEKLNSDMGGVTFNVKDEDVDKINSMSNAIEAYDQTLIKSAGDAEAAQEAANKLATAYVDHSDVLDNLIDHLDEVTEEEKAYVKEQLEVNGIQNAEEVMTTRLTKKYKAYSAALVDVSKQMAQYRNDVENVIETGEDSNGVASKMKESVTKMLSTYNDEGVAITTPQIDEKFIVDNLAKIKAATEGDIEAFDELMAKVAELNAMQVFIDANIDEETAAIQAANIMDMIAQANAMDIEVGASIDDSAFLDALNEMMSSSQEMADAVSKAFESMGYSVKWNNTKTRAIVPVMHANQGGMLNTQGAGNTNLSAMEVSAREMEFSFPGLEITRIGSASGAGAIYGGHSGGSSGGGGGGGGGGGSSSEPNKPKEESEETFDWIEVAIQRIEEEIARLDKVVGNSYDFWTKRNTALLKEIDKTKEEIKAQQLAYSEYLRNANEVKVNNGKGLNDDDYGENDSLVKAADQKLLDEAKKAWATGEYQKKVQEGLMTGKDIEKIQNHFLSEAVKQYQELYQKAISAQDAVQDLKIKLGDLARTNFDHVKGEAEDAISYFESYADLINARIERTEEKGYFATKTFQGALISYEQERLKVLKKEYDELIAKRDEATRTKAILPYSEEFNKMNQEILEVGKSIEEATTNLVKFNNEMRQHDWDVFDFTQERINNIAEEFDFLIDLLDNQKLYDDYGLFNSRGWADSALHAGKYNAYMEQALQYAKEREKIEADLKKDNADKNLIERREELIKLQQESITNAYAEKEAVKSLVEEGINIHLDALSKLIDEYKTSLKEAKSLYDYQKNIANQTKNITNLQKQLAAYTGDDSEETRALRQRLNKQLEDAQTQLRETQWDKYISETEEFLGDMYEEYEELLNKQLEDIDKLMHDMIGEINTHGSDIRTAINDVTKDVAYKMTDNANTFLETGTLVSDFKVNFDNYSTTILKAVGDIVTAVQSIANETVTAQVNGKAVGKSNIKVNTVRNGVDYADVFDINYYMAHNPDLQKAFGDDYDKYLDHFIKNGMKEARQAIETFNVDIYKANYKDLRDAFGSDLVAYYLHYIRNGKREKRKAYAGGSQHINSNQLAWTQDGGGELIYRSSDGAILTPLNIGDKVFTNEMSENLWKLAQLKPTIPTGNARTITNNNAIAITLPNVTNYEQFKTALQNDPKMVGFIQQVTLGEANGSAKLNKRKY